MTTVIIDDNVKAADELKRQLEKYPDFKVEGIARNSFDGLAMIGEKHPNVIFLDVNMPGISGLEFLDRAPMIANGKCRVVMYTAYAEHILPAIRKRAFDVLLKPIDPNELATIVSRLREAAANPKEDTSEEETEENKSTKDSDMILLYTNAVDFKLVNKNDIGLFRYNSDNRCWEAILGNSKTPISIKRSIKAETLVGLDSQFVQVNQKYIINVNYLIEVVDGKCNFFPPFNDIDYVVVGRMYRKRLTEKFFSL